MEELPQIVWLRGDEPYCSTFALDAEAVMQRLGIKRTRLTQISGRELRVGRIRRGRYVAPVYRAEDVEAYAAWTRPTAAHLKSSQVLEDAARALSQQGDAVAERVHDDLEHLLAEVADDFRARGREQERLADDRVEWLARRLDEIEARAGREQAALQDKLTALIGALGGMRTGFDRVVFLLETHNRELAETKAAVSRLGDRTGSLEDSVARAGAAAQGALGSRFTALDGSLLELGVKADGAQSLLAAALAALAAPPPEPAEEPAPAEPANKHISVYRRAARRYARK